MLQCGQAFCALCYMKQVGEKEQMVHTSTHTRYPVSHSAQRQKECQQLGSREGSCWADVESSWGE